MAYNEKLADRIRETLGEYPHIEEKKMFRGITFMINGKMCISVGDNEMMCRIDPKMHEAAIGKKGCCTMQMKGREYIGYVLVSEEGMKSKKILTTGLSLHLILIREQKLHPKKRRNKF